MYPWAQKNLLEETSIYTSHEQIVIYMKNERPKKCIFGGENDRALKLVPYREDKPVYFDESSDPDGPFCYSYTTVFKKFLICLPLFNFEKKNFLPKSMSPQPSYIPIARLSFGVSPFFAHILAFCHMW